MNLISSLSLEGSFNCIDYGLLENTNGCVLAFVLHTINYFVHFNLDLTFYFFICVYTLQIVLISFELSINKLVLSVIICAVS